MRKLIFIIMLILAIVCQNNNLLAAAKTGSAAATAADPVFAATQELFSVLASGPTVEKIDKALKNGADLNGLDKYGETPLLKAIFSACFFGSSKRCIEIVKLLLDNGADVNNARSRRGNTLLIEATLPLIYTNQVQIVKLLLDHGANVNIPNKDGETFLSFINKQGFEKAKEAYEKYEKSVELDQKQVVYQMSRVDALRIFPPGLLPMIANYLFYINK